MKASSFPQKGKMWVQTTWAVRKGSQGESVPVIIFGCSGELAPSFAIVPQYNNRSPIVLYTVNLLKRPVLILLTIILPCCVHSSGHAIDLSAVSRIVKGKTKRGVIAFLGAPMGISAL
jgi:hypothetical protein